MVSRWKDRIPEWDEPSPDNDDIAARFSYEDYRDGSFFIPYRLYVPKSSETQTEPIAGSKRISKEKLPIVLFLHGADVTGTDNEVHIRAHDIGTMFAKDEWQQEHPCIVIAPQYRNGLHWSRPRVMEALVHIVDDILLRYPCADAGRVYLYGYSAGGIGGLKMMKTYPSLFARALILCAATNSEDMDKLAATPFWLFHAHGDRFVAIDRLVANDDTSHLGSAVIYEKLHPVMGDDIRYTEYAAGELEKSYGIDPHCVWVPVSRDEAAKRWLFEGAS